MAGGEARRRCFRKSFTIRAAELRHRPTVCAAFQKGVALTPLARLRTAPFIPLAATSAAAVQMATGEDVHNTPIGAMVWRGRGWGERCVLPLGCAGVRGLLADGVLGGA